MTLLVLFLVCPNFPTLDSVADQPWMAPISLAGGSMRRRLRLERAIKPLGNGSLP